MNGQCDSVLRVVTSQQQTVANGQADACVEWTFEVGVRKKGAMLPALAKGWKQHLPSGSPFYAPNVIFF
ncbi:hypothetical protein BZK31_26370 [Pseudomonas floridensis]|uniref:Uncharacterized protein n=1 Tax=Pseudomonas floridensis TaxID=1958950 RepID=A0A1X0MYC4_9PSED|nr:hypothetical protein BZK31_26370 [Pseudomonas floridensis]